MILSTWGDRMSGVDVKGGSIPSPEPREMWGPSPMENRTRKADDRGMGRLRSALVAALIPWLAYMAAMALADRWVDFRSVTLELTVRSVPFTLAVVALPSLGAITAARTVTVRRVATVVMTAVSAYAGIAVIATDDGQAGLAVLWVPIVAAPLALLLLIGGAAAEAWQHDDLPGLRSHLLLSASVAGGVAGLFAIAALSKVTNTTGGDHPLPIVGVVLGTAVAISLLVARAHLRHRMSSTAGG